MGTLGGIKQARFIADGSFGSSRGQRVVSVVVQYKSTARAIANVRSATIAGSIITPGDLCGAAGTRSQVLIHMPEDGVVMSAKGMCEVSGASTVCHVYYRNL